MSIDFVGVGLALHSCPTPKATIIGFLRCNYFPYELVSKFGLCNQDFVIGIILHSKIEDEFFSSKWRMMKEN